MPRATSASTSWCAAQLLTLSCLKFSLSLHRVCRLPTFDRVICWLQFVNLRVLRLAQDDPLVWQRALLKAEVRGCTGCHWMQTPVCSFETVQHLTKAYLLYMVTHAQPPRLKRC
jgi:hypothetical protein